jgi:DNA-binding PadR family transcriptional regulator
MKTEDLQRTIIKMFRGSEFYGYQVHKKLVADGITIEISRLYRVLNKMLKEGYLKSRWEKSRFGPKKRVYCFGKRGKEELEKNLSDAIRTVHEYYLQYLLDLPPKSNIFNSIGKLLTKGLKKTSNVAYVATKNSIMHEKIVNIISNKITSGKVYFIKPKSVPFNLGSNNLLFLDGAYDDIPVKDGCLDLLVVIDAPPKNFLKLR